MDIEKGQEITISYTNKPKSLYANYGFNCDCPQCYPVKDVERLLETLDGVVPKI
jgi:hypothetical protein